MLSHIPAGNGGINGMPVHDSCVYRDVHRTPSYSLYSQQYTLCRKRRGRNEVLELQMYFSMIRDNRVQRGLEMPATDVNICLQPDGFI
jgi:hypothetical protein